MNSKRLKILLEKYYEGNTSLEEERELKGLLKSHKQFESILFEVLDRNNQESLPVRFDQKIKASDSKPKVIPFYHWQWMAASVLLLLIAVYFLIGYNQSSSTSQELAQIQLGLESRLVSERLKTIFDLSEKDQIDESTKMLLLKSVQSDQNMNVRLAAIRTINKAPSQSMIKSLIDSLAEQRSPLVQLALIDLIVSNSDKVAKIEIQNLINTESLLFESRKRLEDAMAL